MHRQGFERGLGVNGKQGAAGSRCGFDVGVRREVEVERSLGGFVEFL
jgi:hypothetical protein